MVSPVSVLYFLNLPVIPGFSGYMNTFANTYTVPCWVCERSWGSSSMHQLLVGQYAIPGSAGSIAQGCWSLPPIADGQAWVLRCASSGECSLTFTGRPVKEHSPLEAHRNTRSEEHTSELQPHSELVCRLLL